MSNRWKWIFWASLIFIFILSLVPTSPALPGTGWDKSNHSLAFACLMILAGKAYPVRNVLTFPGLILYGGLIEVSQSLTSYRYAEWGDIFADVLGLLVGLALGKLLWPCWR